MYIYIYICIYSHISSFSFVLSNYFSFILSHVSYYIAQDGVNSWLQIILLPQPPKELRQQMFTIMPSLMYIFEAKIVFIFDIF